MCQCFFGAVFRCLTEFMLHGTDHLRLLAIFHDGQHIGKKQMLVAMLGAAIEEEAKEDEEGVMVRAFTVADIMSDGKLVELVKEIEREKAHLCIKDDK